MELISFYVYKTLMYLNPLNALLNLTDGHHGPILDPSSPSGTTLYGDQAPLLRRSIQDFAELQRIPIIVDGGDRNTFEEDGEDFSEYRAATDRVMAEYPGQYYEADGNHDGDGKTGLFYKPKKTQLITDLNGFEDTSLILIQPNYINDPTDPHFTIDEAQVLRALDNVTTSNLIIASHFSLFKDGKKDAAGLRNTPKIRGDFSKIRGQIHDLSVGGVDVLCLSGHSHYFALSTHGEVRSLTMPSFVQEDAEHRGRACGLFNIIKENRHGLGITFHQAIVNPGLPRFVSPAKLTYQVEEVGIDYMELYQKKPFIPPRQDWAAALR